MKQNIFASQSTCMGVKFIVFVCEPAASRLLKQIKLLELSELVGANQGLFQGSIYPLSLGLPPWEFCSDSESIQVF